MIDSIEELSIEQSRFYFYQKKMNQLKKKRRQGEEEGPEEEELAIKVPVEPSSLKTVLKTNQILNYCDQVNQFSGQSLSKLFLL